MGACVRAHSSMHMGLWVGCGEWRAGADGVPDLWATAQHWVAGWDPIAAMRLKLLVYADSVNPQFPNSAHFFQAAHDALGTPQGVS